MPRTRILYLFALLLPLAAVHGEHAADPKPSPGGNTADRDGADRPPPVGRGATAAQTTSPSQPDAGWRLVNAAVVEGHLIPRYQALAQTARNLDTGIRNLCDRRTETDLVLVREGFTAALDAWNGISHIRFGPVDTDRRYYRIQLWPDKRGTGQRQVRQLLADQNDARLEPAAFPQESVAVQGLNALEMLLFPVDEVALADFEAAGGPSYRCRFAQAIGRTLADMATAILRDWTQGERSYRATLLQSPPATGQTPFADPRALAAEWLKALNTGAQVVHHLKLAEPLGPAGGPANPRKAESWRSRRSLANVCTNLRALEHLYATAFAPRLVPTPASAVMDHGLALTLVSAAGACLSQPGTLLDEPATPEGDPARRQALEHLRELAGAVQARSGRALAEELDLTIGFNSLDGD